VIEFLLARPKIDTAAARVLEVAATEQPTYDHVGSTLDPAAWPGHDPFERSRIVGHGPAAFEAAIDGLRAWACHRGVRARVHPAGAPLVVGTTVVVELPVGPVRVLVPNRIVAVIDDPTRFGFAYGTLPGHEERGEEGFIIEIAPDGTVTATVRVDAIPGSRAARLMGPAVTAASHVAVGRYLAALAHHVAATRPANGSD
jgi:uncharacterized protein (UPF0548 family)